MKKLDRKKQKNILGMGNNCPTGQFEASYNGYIICCMKQPTGSDLCDPKINMYCDIPYDMCGDPFQ
ncbi:hypothetical protein BAS09_06340 [Elizabethkingia ursingii]|jgi:hypothetical protein|uniref:Uncharacterized protein n=1 Tax=Elizabethkingia ursingii TaxID=1756150 RepID=A0ABX3NA13_9FLAO|nr:hypothetical protein [Elizabethkingia ursingii]KUY31682.1 hypothetical protein ATB96_00020 [Elizabethkingia ursingii]MDR2228093.1 hypothetical protein [Flavobacteriaceae bacterium]OPB89298.1 hypothetical protein BB021_08095 [Elizabethkingia ursingii]OPC05288.1 hypothetical protein BAS09_06340 [Elizabethkingia ursingii]